MNANTHYVMGPDELEGEWYVFSAINSTETSYDYGNELPYYLVFSAARLELYKGWVAEQKAKAASEATKYIERSKSEGWVVETVGTPGLLDALADACTDSTRMNSFTNRLFTGDGWQVRVRSARLSR